jgi:hypothetical protein
VVGWLYQRWTNPSAVRLQVIDRLGAFFAGATVNIDSARLRLLGGISATDVRLTRRDDPDKIEFAYIPSAIIYHDKEQLLHGKLAIRKLELIRPRLRVVRNRQGKWNLAGILGPMHPDEPIPTIIIQQGTILFEDHAACGASDAQAAPPDQCGWGMGMGPVVRMEIKDVNLTFVNDPLSTLLFCLKGQADRIGAVHVEGNWNRISSAIAMSVEAPVVPVQPTLLQWLASYCSRIGEHTQQLEALASLRADITYQPDAVRPWSYDLHCQLSKGKLNHPQLPLPLENVEIKVRCLDGQVTVENCTAQSGPARLSLTGNAMLPPDGTPCGAADLSGTLIAKHLPLTQSFFDRLGETGRTIQDDFSPSGTITLTVEFGRHGGMWHRHCTIEPEDLSARFRKFLYRLDRLQGVIEQTTDPANRIEELHVKLVGYAGQRPVTIAGQMVGEKPAPAIQFEVQGKNLPLDRQLIEALPGAHHQTLAESFHSTGLADFVATVRRRAGAAPDDFDNHILVRFHDATMRYNVFPYPLEEVSGILDIQRGHWEFRDFRGTHKGGEVHGQARSIPTSSEQRVALEIGGSNLLLDPEFEQALRLPKLQQVWKQFAPAGRMSFQAQIDNTPDQPQDIDVTVTVQGCMIKPTFFPYPLEEVTGSVRYTRDQVYLGKFTARHGDTRIELEKGDVILPREGGFYTELTNLLANPLVPDAEFMQALPKPMRQACQSLQLRDPLRLNTKLIVSVLPEPGSPPIVYWDGGLELRDGRLVAGVPLEHLTGKVCCRGRLNGHVLEGVFGNVLVDEVSVLHQPFSNLHCHIDVPRDSPQVLRLPDLKARLFGGDLGGTARIEFGPSLRYDVNLTALQVKLEEFGKHNLKGEDQISGPVSARLYLTGRGADINGLEGRGTIDVPSGQMYNLPVLLQLLKFLGLRAPDPTAFEEAHAAFEIHGPRVNVQRLDLYGGAISLSGQGEMNLDGSDLQLDFYAVWGRIVQWLPPLIKEIPPTIGQSLLKVKMRGKVSEPHFEKEPVPILVEPVEKLLKRLQGPADGKEASNGPDARDQTSRTGLFRRN